MRAHLRLLCLALLLGLGGPVLPQAAPRLVVAEAQQAEPRRGGQPPRELRDFQGGFRDEYAEPRIGLFGYLSLTAIGAVLFLIMTIVFRQQARELGLPEDESELAASRMAAGGGGAVGVGAKESVFGAVSRAGGWVTAGRVALAAGLGSDEVESLLEELRLEARVKAGRDKRGRRLYRVAE